MPKAKQKTSSRSRKAKDHVPPVTPSPFGRNFRPRRLDTQNILPRLFSREINGSRHKRNSLNSTRGFYTNVCPNYTLVNVEKPPCFLRKFTPDGKRFIAFSADQTHLEIYEYGGAGTLGKLMHKLHNDSDHLRATDESEHAKVVRASAFDAIFGLEHFIPLTTNNNEQLNRECSLFSEDGEYVIVGSASYIPEDHHPPMHQLHKNNESVAPNPRNPLEDYTLYAIEIAEGIITDHVEFKTDKIFLSHNQGLYLYRDFIAVLSVQHQTIHLFKFQNGQFTPFLQIGRTLYENDELLLSQTLTPRQQTGLPGNFVYRAYREKTINMLKHRFLVFLYRRAAAGSLDDLRRFYQHFESFGALRIWKMQMLDDQHFLLKYASEDVVTLRSPEPNSQISFFVVYNYVSTKVTAVYENTSEDLLDHFEHYCDFFRNTNLNFDNYKDLRFCTRTSSPSNNIHADLIQQRFKQTIVSAKNGGVTEARKRVLAQLPISAQSYSSSPYLDLSLYSYDEKWVSVMERPKVCGEHPIQFYGRESGLLKFRIHPGLPNHARHQHPQQQGSSRRLVAFIFHPTDPFAISVQKTVMDYVVNFHVRRDYRMGYRSGRRRTEAFSAGGGGAH
jgi:de-etiolated-1